MLKIDEKRMITVVPFWMDLGASIFYLAAPLMLIELGGNPVELGLIGTITATVHMTLANLVGRFSDRLGRRRLIVAGPLIFCLSCLIMTQVREVKGVLALAALNGVGMAIFWPTFQAYIAGLRTGGGLARNIGSFNMSWTASHLIGPTISGLLFGLYPRLPFWVAAALSLLLFLAIRASVTDSSPPMETGRPPIPAEPEEPGGARGFLYAIWVANFASWFILANVRYQFPKLALDLAVDPYVIGIFMSCIGLSQFLGFFFLRKTDRWHFQRSYLLGAQVLAAAGLVVIFSSRWQVLFALSFILIGLSASLTYYSSLYYAVRLLKGKGQGAGLHESILGSGVVLGPLLGGIAAHSAGLRAPYLLCLAVLISAVAVEIILTKKKPGAAAAKQP